MPLTIPDETLRAAGLTEREALVEIACRLFDAGRLALWPAARLARLSRDEFLAELHDRHIPAFRPTAEDFLHDLETIDRIRGAPSGRSGS